VVLCNNYTDWSFRWTSRWMLAPTFLDHYAWIISPLNRYANPIRTTNRLLRAV
jgi:hypothetical protein